MLQVKLVNIIGLVAILIGIGVNLMRTGVWSSVTFAALGFIGLYLVTSQIACLINGRCFLSSWTAAITALLVFISLGYFYSWAFVYNVPLPSIDKQPIANSYPAIVKTRDIIKNITDIDIYNLQDYMPF